MRISTFRTTLLGLAAIISLADCEGLPAPRAAEPAPAPTTPALAGRVNPVCIVQCEIAATLTCTNPNNPTQTNTITHLNCEGGGGQNKLCNCQGERCELACSGQGFCKHPFGFLAI